MLKVFFDGAEVASVGLSGTAIENDGDLYIGRAPWNVGIAGVGIDNV